MISENKYRRHVLESHTHTKSLLVIRTQHKTCLLLFSRTFFLFRQMIVLSRFIISFLAIVDCSIAAVNPIIRLPMTDYMVNITIAGPAEFGDIGYQSVPMMIVPGSHSVAANMNPLVPAGSPQWHRLIFTPSNQVLIEPTLTFSPTATHSIFSIGHMSRVVQVYGGVAVVKNLGTTNGEVVIGHEDAPRIFEASCEPDTVMEIPGPFRVFGSIGLSNVDGSTLNVRESVSTI